MDLESLLGPRPLVVLDGGMGTQLMALGLTSGAPGEMWNLERPDAIEGVQRAYVEAGADCLITNTFGACPVALARHGLDVRAEEIARAGVEVARRAAGGRALVLGGFGPTGGMLEPYGDLTDRQVGEAYGRQARAFAEAGVDGLIFETFESSRELALAIEAALRACDSPAIASMKFSREPSGRYRTLMGEGPDRLLAVAAECGCAALGTNCGRGIVEMIPLVRELAARTSLPVMAEPNAGMPRLEGGRTVYAEDAAMFARHLTELYEAGARLIGGCCGTTPDHIRAVRAFADSL